MSFFYQKIAYIGLYEENQRSRNIGFVKIRANDSTCTVEIQITTLLFMKDTFICDIYYKGTNKKLDELSIQDGKAQYVNTFAMQKIGKSEIAFDEFSGIEIHFPGGKKGIATWEKAKEMPTAPIEEIHKTQSENTDKVKTKASNITQIKSMEKARTEEYKKARTDEDKKANKEESQRCEAQFFDTIPKNIISAPPSYQNKWQQLRQLYPIIMPFQNQQAGEYLSITPKDFVILNEIHQHLVHNSFLLHGYYNYRHLLLGKRIEREKELYYIGVPGNYYKREKMVAVMFGFEAFEPTNQEEEEVMQGTFGYYLKEVTI